MMKLVTLYKETINENKIRSLFKGVNIRSKEQLEKIKESIREQLDRSKETKEIIQKWINSEKISPDEQKYVRQWFIRVLKGMGFISAYIVIPGSAVLFPLLYYIWKRKTEKPE